MARSVTFSSSPIIITPPITTNAVRPPTPPPQRSKSKSVTFSNTTSHVVITPSAAPDAGGPWLPPTRPETVAHIASAAGKTVGTVQSRFTGPEQDQQYQSWRSEPVYLQREQVIGLYRQAEATQGAEREGQLFYYYPTPARGGNHGIAADANRFTTMFSDENPNACSIV
ncbi:hypothetical protein QJS04_geneDACA017588 [Acorus gramineus]|uniref:Uncharacterized protein n=1 Tax=Acorus gramineus TaxID=55184 RepID=A0AAV9AW82_ACOGR|nr:hypothetical protein QJS04_geneDACA017588 [Acorus gramineus]